MADFLNITHVIFDVDGLLLDTEHLYTEMLQSFANEYNKKFTMDIKLKQMGRKNEEAALVFITELQIPITIEEYIEKMGHLQRQYLPNVKLMPGVEKLVNHLLKHEIPMAIATGSCEDSYMIKTSKHKDFFSKFSHVALGSDPDLVHGKPAPDIYLNAAKRFKNPPLTSKNVLVFEDAVNGVRAGLAANMNVVWVPDLTITPARELEIENNSLFLLNSLDEFDPKFFGLPSYH